MSGPDSPEGMILREVLDEIVARGIVVQMICIGQVKLALAAPWPPPKLPAPKPIDPQAAEVVRQPSEFTEEQWAKLRKSSRETFGRVLTDEQLKEFAGHGML